MFFFFFFNRNNVIKDYQKPVQMKGDLNVSLQNDSIKIQANATVASTDAAAAAAKKKRPTKQVYVPRGRRNLVESNAVSPPSTSPSPDVQRELKQTNTDLLIDSSIVGYLKDAPSEPKPKIEEVILEKQMEKLNLSEATPVDSWDSLYNEHGECKNEKFIKEVIFFLVQLQTLINSLCVLYS